VVSMCLLASTAAKLEGAALIGDRSVAFAGVDDPVVLRQFGNFMAGRKKVVERKVCDSLGLGPKGFTLSWRVCGRPMVACSVASIVRPWMGRY
jgi:hypothetical protein